MVRATRARPVWAALIAGLSLPSLGAWMASSGCGTEISYRPAAEGGGGATPWDEGGGGREPAPTASTGPDAGPDGFDAWVDPPCENQPPPLEDYACDPYDQGNGDCLPGEACDIFVEYPTEPCGQEIYGSMCLPAGPGEQGDSCGSPLDCAAGFVCVVTGSGTQCVQYCSLTGDSGCPDGLVCEPIDVEGFGGCL